VIARTYLAGELAHARARRAASAPGSLRLRSSKASPAPGSSVNRDTGASLSPRALRAGWVQVLRQALGGEWPALGPSPSGSRRLLWWVPRSAARGGPRCRARRNRVPERVDRHPAPRVQRRLLARFRRAAGTPRSPRVGLRPPQRSSSQAHSNWWPGPDQPTLAGQGAILGASRKPPPRPACRVDEPR
jgi:hypothetical protein